MPIKFVCDGCGKEELARFRTPEEYEAAHSNWHFPVDPRWTPYKPFVWYERADDDTGPQFACSNDCIRKIDLERRKSKDLVKSGAGDG